MTGLTRSFGDPSVLTWLVPGEAVLLPDVSRQVRVFRRPIAWFLVLRASQGCTSKRPSGIFPDG